MAAGTYDFTIEQGATLSKRLEWRDGSNVLVPLTGLEARMQLRSKIDSTDVILELSSIAGTIVLEDPGVIRLYVGADVTDELDFKTAVYDLEIYDPLDAEVVTRLLKGTITLSKEVTRP